MAILRTVTLYLEEANIEFEGLLMQVTMNCFIRHQIIFLIYRSPLYMSS